MWYFVSRRHFHRDKWTVAAIPLLADCCGTAALFSWIPVGFPAMSRWSLSGFKVVVTGGLWRATFHSVETPDNKKKKHCLSMLESHDGWLHQHPMFDCYHTIITRLLPVLASLSQDKCCFLFWLATLLLAKVTSTWCFIWFGKSVTTPFFWPTSLTMLGHPLPITTYWVGWAWWSTSQVTWATQ